MEETTERRGATGTARRQERVNVSIPLLTESGDKGQTVNVSPTGLYFVIDRQPKAGAPLRLTLELDSPGGKLYLECTSEILRIEKTGDKLGVAARITESRLERRNAKSGV